MPGISFIKCLADDVASIQDGLFANSMTGTGTPPAAYLRAGDVVVATTKSTLTAAAAVVIRMLLAADKTAHYKEGTPVAGILGVAAYGAATDGGGAISGGVLPANVAASSQPIYNFPSAGSGISPDSNTNRDKIQYYPFNALNIFSGVLDATSSAATPALNGTLAGFILTTSNGVTTYTIHTGAAAADQCIIILGCDEVDPLYGSVGGRVFFQGVPSFCQSLTGVPYSTQ
jgi:hypothetical protein